MTNSWLKDKITFVSDHFLNLAKQEIIKCAVQSAVLRKHYAFQADMPSESGPLKKVVFETKPKYDLTFEMEIETEELADSEEVVNLGEYTTKINAIFDQLESLLNDIYNYENAISTEIKFTSPKVEEAPPPKSPKGKGKKSPKPKSAGKKGKKSATPVEEKGPDPILVAKQERGDKCREEAKEGIKLIEQNTKRNITIIKSVLNRSILDTKARFETTFKVLFDIIGR